NANDLHIHIITPHTSCMIGLSNGESPNAIAMGVIDAICKRTATFTKRLSLTGTVFFSGGLAQSEIIRATLEKHLGCQVVTHERSQFAGAIGAALIGTST
ncbi:MAG TPA: BadF/BadG/BcrA/BcrD ATPase family protein, partial [Fusibacter sp.]|nr:BadF/BadG/BcrA/BcrD ATPase family protein [Fusibacter sp.]